MMISCSKKLTTLIRLSVCQGKLFHDFIMKYGYSQTNWSNRIIFKISKMPLFGFYPIPSCLFQTFMDNTSTSLWFLKLTRHRKQRYQKGGQVWWEEGSEDDAKQMAQFSQKFRQVRTSNRNHISQYLSWITIQNKLKKKNK